MSENTGLRNRRRVEANPYTGVNGNDSIVQLGYHQERYPNGTWAPPFSFVGYTLNGIGLPFIYGKSTYDEIHKGPPYVTGGPFRSVEISSCEPFAAVNGYGTYYRRDGEVRYVGGFMPPSVANWGGLDVGPLQVSLAYNSPLFPSLSEWGDKAYARCRPKLEKASAAVFLAEGRDMKPMLQTTAKLFKDLWIAQRLAKDLGKSSITLAKKANSTKFMQPKAAANHFINHQFGWSPFIGDIWKFIHAYHNSSALIRRLMDENGKWIKKRVTLLEDSTKVVLASGVGPTWPAYGPTLFPQTAFADYNVPWLSAPATWELSESKVDVVTAVGKFRFYRPEFDWQNQSNPLNGIERDLTLYGLRVSPINVYRAIPWSWALDWVTNTGDYIQRCSDAEIDSVASEYLYCMRHQVIKRTYTTTIPMINPGPITLTFERIVSTKQRGEGNSPYGFSLSLANLTPRQLTIAGALGILRL